MRTPSDDAARPLVLYDGGCPLCRREIDHYRRIDTDNRLIWADITRENRLLADLGVSHRQVMERLHVLGADGNWRTGAFAFVEIWSRLPFYRRLAGLLRRSHLTPLLDRLYAPFARWRMARRCAGACETAQSHSGPGRSA
jgi:predicted DCC family thiol-disulfide oxidoreductase YuxK